MAKLSKRIAKRIYHEFTPVELARWKQAIAETLAEKERILKIGREIKDRLSRRDSSQ